MTHSLATNKCKSLTYHQASRTYGPNGELLIYQIDYRNGWMALWNSTDCGLQNAKIGTPDYGSWGNTAHGNADPTANDWSGPILKRIKPTMLLMERNHSKRHHLTNWNKNLR